MKMSRLDFIRGGVAATAVTATALAGWLRSQAAPVRAEGEEPTSTPTEEPTATPEPSSTPEPTATATPEPEPTSTPEPSRRPNFLVIVTDDQDYSSWAEPFTFATRTGKPLLNDEAQPQKGYAMPFLRSFPEGGWVDFQQAAVAAPICGPSRASLLTGVPAGTVAGHGVLRNGELHRLDESNTLAVWLEEAGYEVALRGKYNFGDNERYRPKPPGYAYFNLGGRAGTVFRDGEEYIREYAARGATKPLCLFLTPTDPHVPLRPQGAHANLNLIPSPAPPNYDEEDVSDKPAWVRRLRRVGQPGRFAKTRKKIIQTLLGVDDGIRSVFNALQETGLADNTIIIFTSDNGHSFGSHRLGWKGAPYDESVRVPLVIRFPWLAGNRAEDRAVSHLDVTATIVDLSGAAARRPLVGRSIKPMIEEPETYWEGVTYIEGHGSAGDLKEVQRPIFRAIRTSGAAFGRYTYVELPETGERELYDLEADPWQMNNLAGLPQHAELEDLLSNRLHSFTD